MDIGSQFREIVSLALNSNYAGSDWFKRCPSLMFVNLVVNRNECFGDDVQNCGATYCFSEARTSEKQETDGEKGHELPLRTTDDLPDLEELITGSRVIDSTVQDNIIEWLEDLYKSSRGFELGTFDKNLLARTMSTQSARWEHIARGYILDIVHFAHCFITDLLRLVCPSSSRVREGIMSVLMEPLMDVYRKALQQVDFILHVERNNPLTVNHYFNENLEHRTRSPCSILIFPNTDVNNAFVHL